MKKTIILLLTIFGCNLAFSQPSKIVGDWLLKSITEENSIASHPYQIMTFAEDGSIFTAPYPDKPIASWELGKEVGAIFLISNFDDPDFDGKKNLTFPDDNIMIIAMTPEQNYHFRKLDWESINLNHQQSGLLGTWKLAPLSEHDDGTVNILTFEENGKYKYMSSSPDGVTQSHRDIWLYNHLEKSLLISASELFHFRGMNTVLKVTPEKFVIETSHGKLEATKVKTKNSEITWLNFDSEFVSDENEADKLPVLWKMYDKMLHFLEPIKQLTYDFGVKVDEAEVLKYSLIVKKIEVNPQKESVKFTNIHVTPTDSMQYSENYKGNLMEMNNDFFPESEPDRYKVVGTEKITVSAGTFSCTVVEAVFDSKKLKYWMINDRPGIYAKIIEQKLNRFTGKIDYSLIKLKRIESL